MIRPFIESSVLQIKFDGIHIVVSSIVRIESETLIDSYESP